MRLVTTFGAIFLGYISCSAAQAQDTAKSCDVECLRQKVSALEHAVDELQSQIKSAIKSGQNVTLKIVQGDHPGGCLTYIGPSGSQGGPVQWSMDCSHGTLWAVNPSRY